MLLMENKYVSWDLSSSMKSHHDTGSLKAGNQYILLASPLLVVLVTPYDGHTQEDM